MILKIAHRILNFEDYYKLPQKVGLEFDIHAYGDQLVISHDAFCDGIKFEDFISQVKDRFLAINIKEEGIEKRYLISFLKKVVKTFSYLMFQFHKFSG